MSPEKPTAQQIKAEFRRLCQESPEGLNWTGALVRLANTPEAVAAVAGEAMERADVRKALVGLGRFMEGLERWAGITEHLGRKDSAGQDAPASVEEVRVAARQSSFDDPSVLARAGRVKVHVDGASKGNPGPAGVGVVVMDLEGQTLYETCRYIGTKTNGVAEYMGLITALEVLVENGAPETYVFSDSEFMVKQMNGLYKVRTEAIMPLIQEAQRLRRKLPKFQIVHVPRGKNQRADELANLAIRQARDASVM